MIEDWEIEGAGSAMLVPMRPDLEGYRADVPCHREKTSREGNGGKPQVEIGLDGWPVEEV